MRFRIKNGAVRKLIAPMRKGKKGFQNGFDIYEHMEKNKKNFKKSLLGKI